MHDAREVFYKQRQRTRDLQCTQSKTKRTTWCMGVFGTTQKNLRRYLQFLESAQVKSADLECGEIRGRLGSHTKYPLSSDNQRTPENRRMSVPRSIGKFHNLCIQQMSWYDRPQKNSFPTSKRQGHFVSSVSLGFSACNSRFGFNTHFWSKQLQDTKSCQYANTRADTPDNGCQTFSCGLDKIEIKAYENDSFWVTCWSLAYKRLSMSLHTSFSVVRRAHNQS